MLAFIEWVVYLSSTGMPFKAALHNSVCRSDANNGIGWFLNFWVINGIHTDIFGFVKY